MKSSPPARTSSNGWRWLIEQANSGDQLFFHFSGHGSQSISDDPNEPDGYDETLVPSDSRITDENGNQVYDILDKELAALIAAAEKRGRAGYGCVWTAAMPVRAHVRLSLCAGPRPTAAPDLPPRFCPKPAGTRTVASRHWSGKLGSDHVLLAGCRDEEMSHEYRSPTNGVWYGAMTFYLLQKLQELHPQMSWREVYDAVQTQVPECLRPADPAVGRPWKPRRFSVI